MKMYDEVFRKYIHDGFKSLTNIEIDLLDNEFEKDDRTSFEIKEKIRSEIKLFRRQERFRRNQFKEKVARASRSYFRKDMTVTVSKMEGKYYGFVTEDNKVVALSILDKGGFVENVNLKLVDGYET